MIFVSSQPFSTALFAAVFGVNDLKKGVGPRSPTSGPDFDSPARVLARAESEKLSDASARVV
jgi:hypothetical protein